jgi:large subunit ribosomal protein L1
MSKTSQENKKKELAVEVQEKIEGRNASVEEVKETPAEEIPTEVKEETAKTVRTAKVRGKKYLAAKKNIDVNKYYPLGEAVKLVKTTSLSKFDGKIEAHVTTYDIGNIGDITFPHLETTSKKVVVLNDIILAEIKEGKINFDILIATPVTMPRLLPFAKTLGPKGLMPNPKNGTLTDKPEEAVARLSVAKATVKTEKKAPIIHMIVGKVSQSEEELAANIAELIRVINPAKIKKLAVCATMGPSVKIEVIK